MPTKPDPDFSFERTSYGPEDNVDSLPEGVQLSMTAGPWWTVKGGQNEMWDHVAWMGVQWHAEPQLCAEGDHECTPEVSLVWTGGQRRMFWCAEHQGGIEAYQSEDTTRMHAGPGWWVPVPDGKVRLICCNRGGPRHPEFDGKLFDDGEAAMRFAWEQGFLGLKIFPWLRKQPAR